MNSPIKKICLVALLLFASIAQPMQDTMPTNNRMSFLLIQTCITDDLECAKLALENGADVNTVHKEGWTPLTIACRNGYTNLAKYLIEKGANIDVGNKVGESVLKEALRNNNLELINYLVGCGAIDRNNYTSIFHLAHDRSLEFGHYLRNCFKYLEKRIRLEFADLTELDNEIYSDLPALGTFHLQSYQIIYEPFSTIYLPTNRLKFLAWYKQCTPNGSAFAALAISIQKLPDIQRLVPTIPNFKFDYLIKFAHKKNLQNSLHELCHLKFNLTNQKPVEWYELKPFMQYTLFSKLQKQKAQTHDVRFNFTTL